ncbi:TPR-like protein [Thozetella sp. PMI_491]|nr:TPR-like protein [Thozetella sp. PMI_491]
MRLLERNNAGEISLANDFIANVPRYAILSHTWGDDEVTFSEMSSSTGSGKLGYSKIRFCAEQAWRDGLRFCWVDTCCIDKSSSAELQEAINSMFRWYRDAAKCYVYLADVSAPVSGSIGTSSEPVWLAAFLGSRWFTRGWTLQELIAPASVEFFSKEGICLGNRRSLENYIYRAAGLSLEALRGKPLFEFTVQERMAWMEKRETTRQEDKAYAMLGILGVFIPLIYGEGRDHAFNRLLEAPIIESALDSSSFDTFALPLRLTEVTAVTRFIGRIHELEQLHAILGKADGRRTAVLQGMGGMGKTQLAIAYLRHHQSHYSATIWLNARNDTTLQQSFARTADLILRQHPTFIYIKTAVESRDANAIVNAVKQWLDEAQNDRWLLVYDNYDDPELSRDNLIDKIGGATMGSLLETTASQIDVPTSRAFDIRLFFPESYHGAILITTRSSLVPLGEIVRLGKILNVEDSLAILASTSHRQDLKNDAAAVQVATRLDGLPLALSTAGAYLDQVSTSWAEYLELYQESWLQLQKASPQLLTYDHAMFSTWNISFRHIERRSQAAAMLLRLWAYFSNEDLWYELLKQGEFDNVSWLGDLTKDRIAFDSAMRLLCSHGLVDADPATKECGAQSLGYNVHGCVHSWMVCVLNSETDFEMVRLAIRCVARHVPDHREPEYWQVQRRLLQHANRGVEMTKRVLCLEGEDWWVSYNLGNLYADQGRLSDAEPMYERALQGYTKALGPEHTSTLRTVNSLGVLYEEQGRFSDAESMYERALQGYEKALGPEHTSTLDIVNNLGTLYREQGRLSDAEAMYERAFQGYEKALGPEHTSTLYTVNNLGTLYREQDRLSDAEAMYERSLHGKEKAFGPEHTSTLRTVNNLGVLYQEQGRLSDAEAMYERALQGYEKAFGPEHTSTFYAVNNLGNLYREQGRLSDAEAMYERSLHGKERAFGPEHTSTLQTVNNLGVLYEEQGRLSDAEAIYKRALQGYEKAMGDERVSIYPPALDPLENLGCLLDELGKTEEARLYYARAMDGVEKVYGIRSRRYQQLASRLNNC